MNLMLFSPMSRIATIQFLHGGPEHAANCATFARLANHRIHFVNIVIATAICIVLPAGLRTLISGFLMFLLNGPADGT